MPERDLIREFERILRVRSERVLLASGDDAAVVRAGGVAVTSVDAIIEGVHFGLDTHSPGDVGHKALAAALSDLAAMGAEAGEAYVVLGTSASFGERQAIELVEAMESLAERSGVTIAGGDLTAAPTLTVSVTVVGAAGRDPLELAAAGGDDYELLFTAAPDRRETVESTARAAGVAVTWVGSVAAGSGVRLLGRDGRPVELSGYEHP